MGRADSYALAPLQPNHSESDRLLSSAFVQDFPAVVLAGPVLAFVHLVFEIAARILLSESDNS